MFPLMSIATMAELTNQHSPGIDPEKTYEAYRAMHKLGCITELDTLGARGVAATGAARFDIKEFCSARLILVGSDLGLGGKRLLEFATRLKLYSAKMSGFGSGLDYDISFDAAIQSLIETKEDTKPAKWTLQTVLHQEIAGQTVSTTWYKFGYGGVVNPEPWTLQQLEGKGVQILSQIPATELLFPLIKAARALGEA